MKTRLRAELARCDAEIAHCVAGLGCEGSEGLGALIGLRDWSRERRLIVAAAELPAATLPPFEIDFDEVPF